MGITRLEKEPDHDNVFNSLIEDTVGRNNNLWQFACFCAAQESRCSIALDSGWGMGKTFFLKQLELLFNQSDLEENEQNGIEDSFRAFKGENKIASILRPHTCVYYDAWLNDNAEDPMRSLLYCLIKHKSDQFLKQSNIDEESKRKINAFINNVKEYAKKVYQFNDKKDLLLAPIASLESLLGSGGLTDSTKSFNPTRDIEAQKSFYDAFNNFLNSLIPNETERLLVLIDELDRCNPAYAVQLLERIKHYFSNDRITFVFAINEEQLQHTISAIYGDDFESHHYLDRFFDFRFSLPSPDYGGLRKLLRIDNLDENTWIYKSACAVVVDKFDLTVREAIKYCQWVSIICNVFKNQITNDMSQSLRLVVYIVIPIIYGLRIKDIETLKKFLAGKDISPLKTVFVHNPGLCVFLCHPGISYQNSNKYLPVIDDETSVETEINAVYSALFQSPEDEFPRRTHKFVFDKQVIEILHQASNFMADFINFEN